MCARAPSTSAYVMTLMHIQIHRIHRATLLKTHAHCDYTAFRCVNNNNNNNKVLPLWVHTLSLWCIIYVSLTRILHLILHLLQQQNNIKLIVINVYHWQPCWICRVKFYLNYIFVDTIQYNVYNITEDSIDLFLLLQYNILLTDARTSSMHIALLRFYPQC
jgi:hypothetical protein